MKELIPTTKSEDTIDVMFYRYLIITVSQENICWNCFGVICATYFDSSFKAKYVTLWYNHLFDNNIKFFPYIGKNLISIFCYFSGCQIILNKDLDGLEVTLPQATRNFYVDGHVPQPHWYFQCSVLKMNWQSEDVKI